MANNNIPGISFANNSFTLPTQIYDVFSEMAIARDTKWQQGRQATMAYQQKLNDIQVHDKSKDTLNKAVEGFNSKLQPYIENNRYENIDSALTDAVYEIANNKVLQSDIKGYASLQAYKQSINEQESNRTSSEKAKMKALADQSFQAAGIDEETNEVVDAGFAAMEMFDKANYNKIIADNMKGFIKDEYSTILSKDDLAAMGGKPIDDQIQTIYYKLDQAGIKRDKFNTFLKNALFNDPAVKQSMETDMYLRKDYDANRWLTSWGLDKDNSDPKTSKLYDKSSYHLYKDKYKDKYSSYDDFILHEMGILKDNATLNDVKTLATMDYNSLDEEQKTILDTFNNAMNLAETQGEIDTAIVASYNKYGGQKYKLDVAFHYIDPRLKDRLKNSKDAFVVPQAPGYIQDINSKYTDEGGLVTSSGLENLNKDVDTFLSAYTSSETQIDKLMDAVNKMPNYNGKITFDKERGKMNIDSSIADDFRNTPQYKQLETLARQYNTNKTNYLTYKQVKDNALDVAFQSVTPTQGLELLGDAYYEKAFDPNIGTDTDVTKEVAERDKQRFISNIENEYNSLIEKGYSVDEVVKTLSNKYDVSTNNLTTAVVNNDNVNNQFTNYIKNNLASSVTPVAIDFDNLSTNNETEKFRLDAYKSSIQNNINTNIDNIQLQRTNGDMIENNTVDSKGLGSSKIMGVDIKTMQTTGGKIELVGVALDDEGKPIVDANTGGYVNVIIPAEDATAANLGSTVNNLFNYVATSDVKVDENSKNLLNTFMVSHEYNSNFGDTDLKTIYSTGTGAIQYKGNTIGYVKRIDESDLTGATNPTTLETVPYTKDLNNSKWVMFNEQGSYDVYDTLNQLMEQLVVNKRISDMSAR